MKDKMADVSFRRRLLTFFGPIFQRLDQRHPLMSVQLADIQASVARQHCRSNSLTLRLMLAADVVVSVG